MNGKFNPNIVTIKTFFVQSQRIYLHFQKRAGETLPLPLVAHLWVWLNKDQYPWISLNILENSWKCHSSEYAWSSYGFNRLLKMPRVLNVTGFWMWHGCICKDYREFSKCLIKLFWLSQSSKYTSSSCIFDSVWNMPLPFIGFLIRRVVMIIKLLLLYLMLLY